jgi:hypothetical protein
MAVKKIRVAELAKEIGLTNRDCLLLAQSMGITVKNVSSSMAEAQADRVRRKAAREGLGKPAGSTGVNELKTKVEKRVSQTKQRTRWPLPVAYDDSLFDPKHWMSSPDLKNMRVESAGPLGHSSIYQTGGFAVVAKAVIDGEVWAIRLLYKQQADLEERYQVIHARQQRGELLDVMVPVEYRDDEIGVSGFTDRFPVILVKWVEGTVFNRFVEEACRSNDVEGLKRLLKVMSALEKRMRELRMAHGDLSGDNMMVVTSGAELELKLLDYDSLWLPEIESLKSAVGDGELQHPGVSKSSSGSIGPIADFVAFRMYELGLRALIVNPNLGIDSSCYEHKFLATRDEFIKNSSDATRLMRQLDEKQFDDLVVVLKASYDDLLNRYLETLGEEMLGETPGTAEEADDADVTIFGQLWTLASLVELWELSVGDIRKLASRAGVTSEELAQGISSATAARIAKSQDYVNLLKSKPVANQQVSKPEESPARIWVGEVANQFDLDLNFLVELSGNSWQLLYTASTITEIEAESLRRICSALTSRCLIDIDEIASQIGSVDVRELRERLVFGRHQWVVRKGGRWLLDQNTADDLVKEFPGKTSIREIADDLDVDLNFLVRLAANIGIQRDSASTILGTEATYLRSTVESMLKDCVVPLRDIVAKLEIKDERDLRSKFSFGRDLWVVRTGGIWMVGSSTAAKWARLYPPKQITRVVSRQDQYREIELRLHVTASHVLQVAAEILGLKFWDDASLITNELLQIESRIIEDITKYPVDVNTLLRGKSLDTEIFLAEVSPNLYVRRSYGIRGSVKITALLDEIVNRKAANSISSIASSLAVSNNDLLEVIWDVLGLDGLHETSLLSNKQRDSVVAQVLGDRERFPIRLSSLSTPTGLSTDELMLLLKHESHAWITRSYGTFVDGITSEDLKKHARNERAKRHQLNVEKKITNQHEQRRDKSMRAAQKTVDQKIKFPNLLSDLTTAKDIDLLKLRKAAESIAASFGNPSEHLLIDRTEVWLSDHLAFALIEMGYVKPKRTMGEAIKLWWQGNQCKCDICQKTSKS